MNHDSAAFDPRIADWLEGDPNTAPEPTLRVVLAAFPSIKQRRTSPLAWRSFSMSPIARTAAAVVALVLVIGGVVILGRPGGSGPGGGVDASVSPTGAPSTPAASQTRTPSVAPATPSVAPTASADGNVFPVGDIPAGPYRTGEFQRPSMKMVVGDGWSRKRDDREVFVLSRGELVLAFTHDATAGDVPPGSTLVTFGTLSAYEEIPPASTGADPTLETGRHGPTIYIDEGLTQYDSRIGSVTAYWTLELGGQPLKIKLNGPPSVVQAALPEVRAILASLTTIP